MSDHSAVEIKWDGEVPSPEIIAKVRDSIRDELEDLDRPGDLGFHVVLLGPDLEGPSVCLWGRDDNTFGGEYSAETEWAPLSELEAE
jgi:hypothetical protein